MEGTPSLAFKAVFHEARSCSLQPVVPNPVDDPNRLRIHVLFTEMRETVAALRSAAALSAGLPAELALLVPLIVPYPLALDAPPVSLDFACRRISELASEVPMDLEAFVYLCRDPDRTIADALKPHSLVVIGMSRRWLFNKSRRIARRLRRQGHDVVLANYKKGDLW